MPHAEQRFGLLAAKDGQHVCRFDPARADFSLVAGMNAIDELTVPRVSRVKVRSKAPIDERIGNVGEGIKKLETKALNEERQDILRANAFEAHAVGRAIPIRVVRLLAFQLPVEAIRRRQLLPELLHPDQSFGPAAVP